MKLLYGEMRELSWWNVTLFGMNTTSRPESVRRRHLQVRILDRAVNAAGGRRYFIARSRFFSNGLPGAAQGPLPHGRDSNWGADRLLTQVGDAENRRPFAQDVLASAPTGRPHRRPGVSQEQKTEK